MNIEELEDMGLSKLNEGSDRTKKVSRQIGLNIDNPKAGGKFISYYL